jgi:bifunctional non-homologous end joining protein LigD
MTAVTAGDREIEVSHPERVVFPDVGLTKLDLVTYYAKVADHLLPHVAGRPLTLQRWPDGIDGPGFFTKERPKHFPDFVGAVEVPASESVKKKRGGKMVMAVVDDVAGLVYVANQGMLTPHVWLSRVGSLLQPDRLVFDLDPGPSPFDVVRAAALELRDLLPDLGLVPFVKTTGSSGLHVEVPLDGSATTEEVRGFADDVAALLARLHPDALTTAFSKAEREGRLYLDVARNGQAQTVVAAYGVRAKPTAPVAAPLEWDEVRSSSLGPQRWTIGNIFNRLGRRADPWADMAASARPLAPARAFLDRLRG